MFDNIRLNQLNSKLNLLMQKELNLLKYGKEKEANQIRKEIEVVSQKIESIIGKELDKTGRKAYKLTQTLDKNMENMNRPDGFFPEITDEEAQEKLDEIMRGGR